MMSVTGDQVHEAMVAASITRVDHHDCGGCGWIVFYSRVGDQLFFNPACDCGGWAPPRPTLWADAADWINMQSSAEWRNKLRDAFGLPAEDQEDVIDGSDGQPQANDAMNLAQTLRVAIAKATGSREPTEAEHRVLKRALMRSVTVVSP